MISLSQLARNYGFDESTLRKWKKQGMPHGEQVPDDVTISWIVENQLKPLRNTDVKDAIEKERLRKLKAEADQQELELDLRLADVIDTNYLEAALSEHFKKMKTYLRTIPAKIYIDLFECEDALDLREVLSGIIDSTLTEIGNFEYELNTDMEILKNESEQELSEVEFDLKEIFTDDSTTKKTDTK
ncbi:terminase small subunit [Serratia liquefaciens]|uniref:terminase small subunit n=1 Tax=Serratia liquefaciens TaxID=614 RepID=UPI00217B71E1|nr:terminase small subunit [Serratia liquefaciens]CAI1685297.1 Phage DNA packaging protein Nu1 [Serratia liquefaciens]